MQLQQLALLDGLRPRGDGPPVGRLRPHGHRGREARLRRPRGLVRRPGARRRAVGDAAEPAYTAARRALVGERGVARAAAGVAGRAVAGLPRMPGRRGRGGRRVRRRGADARPRGRAGRRRHLPPRRRRPARQHGLGDAERRLAADLARDPRARLLPGHPRADVLAGRGPAELARAGQAPAHDADAVARAARRRGRARVRHAGRRPAGPVVAPVPAVALRRRAEPPGGHRRADVHVDALPVARSTRGSRSRGTWRSSRGSARA